MQLDESGGAAWALHQHLVGLRRRHAWLHAATTTALRLDNRHYVYRTSRGPESPDSPDALIVALNIDDEPLRLTLAELGTKQAQVLAGSAAPPQEVVAAVAVEPHGWRILRPA